MLIAQVSDIHASTGNDHLLRFERVLTWLEHMSPDVLVLTGDLIDGQWQEGYRQIASRLNHQSYPSLMLPGNSDDRHAMLAEWDKNRWVHDASNNALHFLYDLDGLRLIGLDTKVDAEEYGSVTNHLTWLDRQLKEEHHSPSLVFLHHHVFATGIPTLDETMCRGLGQLEELIRHTRAKVLAISSGHVHRPVASVFAGIPAYICGSVCPANPLWFGTEHVPPAENAPALMIHRHVNNILTSHHVSL